MELDFWKRRCLKKIENESSKGIDFFECKLSLVALFYTGSER